MFNSPLHTTQILVKHLINSEQDDNQSPRLLAIWVWMSKWATNHFPVILAQATPLHNSFLSFIRRTMVKIFPWATIQTTTKHSQFKINNSKLIEYLCQNNYPNNKKTSGAPTSPRKCLVLQWHQHHMACWCGVTNPIMLGRVRPKLGAKLADHSTQPARSSMSGPVTPHQ